MNGVYLLFLSFCCIFVILDSIECLKFMHENGCPWGDSLCEYAAELGRLENLKYLSLSPPLSPLPPSPSLSLPLPPSPSLSLLSLEFIYICT
jgi:hypothetical protein